MNKADEFAQAGKSAVLQNVHGLMEFLQKFPPFNQMEPPHLAYLVEHCRLRFYAAGESILKPADGPVEHFYIVKQGRVHGERPLGSGRVTAFEIASGECFPLAALIGERATRTEHLAAEDTFCLLLEKAAFARLFALSDAFRDFALRGVSSLLDQVNQQVPCAPRKPSAPSTRWIPRCASWRRASRWSATPSCRCSWPCGCCTSSGSAAW